MKQFIQILLTTILAIGISTTAFAQSANTSTDAQATVEANIEVAAQQIIQYGTLNTGTDAGTNNPTQAGYFSVGAAPGSSVSLSFSKNDLTTTSTGDDQTIEINLATSGTEDGTWEDGESADFATASGTNDFFLGNGTNATVAADGSISVWVNPSITLDGTEVSGSYTGDVTLTATYN